MATNDQIINEANEYINNDLTIEETSKKLGISKRTLPLHFKSLELIDSGLFKLVTDKKELQQVRGRVKGGQNGKRNVTWTVEQARFIADEFVKQGLTYEEAEKVFDIPKSTIFEMLNSDAIDEDRRKKLVIAIEENIRKKSIDRIIEENRNYDRKKYL